MIYWCGILRLPRFHPPNPHNLPAAPSRLGRLQRSTTEKKYTATAVQLLWPGSTGRKRDAIRNKPTETSSARKFHFPIPLPWLRTALWDSLRSPGRTGSFLPKTYNSSHRAFNNFPVQQVIACCRLRFAEICDFESHHRRHRVAPAVGICVCLYIRSTRYTAHSSVFRTHDLSSFRFDTNIRNYFRWPSSSTHRR